MGSHMGTLAADAAGNSAWASRTADRSSSSSAPPPPLSRSRTEKFRHLLSVPRVDLTALRTLLWSGAPEDDPTMRAQAWQMLLGYLPPVHERRASGMAKKREEYEELRRQHCHYSGDTSCFIELSRHDGDEVSLQQIRADIPRTSPSLSIFTQPPIQQLMERVLYIWSERHPASGYVQGMNELATPFIAVLLAAEQNAMLEDLQVDHYVGTTLDAVEAGTYWLLTKFLSDIQEFDINSNKRTSLAICASVALMRLLKSVT